MVISSAFVAIALCFQFRLLSVFNVGLDEYLIDITLHASSICWAVLTMWLAVVQNLARQRCDMALSISQFCCSVIVCFRQYHRCNKRRKNNFINQSINQNP